MTVSDLFIFNNQESGLRALEMLAPAPRDVTSARNFTQMRTLEICPIKSVDCGKSRARSALLSFYWLECWSAGRGAGSPHSSYIYIFNHNKNFCIHSSFPHTWHTRSSSDSRYLFFYLIFSLLYCPFVWNWFVIVFCDSSMSSVGLIRSAVFHFSRPAKLYLSCAFLFL